ncbi:MAG: glycoside hydrolase family 88 protein [Clostridiales bacterium]|nr:glycoside hydrolase family 88 protein [Clostridiales bacterium]
MKLDLNRGPLPEVIRAVVQKTMEMDLPWDWPCGVAYYGVAAAYGATGDQEILDLLKMKTDALIALGLPPFTVNTCAMGHCLLSLHQATGEACYLEIAEKKIDYLRNHALRFGDHVLQHTVSVNNDFPEQAWADTLFMAAYFMLRYGVLTKDKELVEDALHQYFKHIEFLQDKATGLWYHGYSSAEKNHMSGFFWARANAWAAYTMAQVKRTLPEPYLYPPFMDIDCSLRDQLTGLKKVQTESGLWRTVLDDSQSYEELSASCGIAAAMVINKNPLHTEHVRKAYPAVLENISADGRVLNVSGGTAVMNDLDGYRRISRTWTQGWGQGLALAFLVAILQTEE